MNAAAIDEDAFGWASSEELLYCGFEDVVRWSVRSQDKGLTVMVVAASPHCPPLIAVKILARMLHYPPLF